ncbi:MAG: 5-oxoprolinase subunit PxpA [Porticoccaceae bacterium]|nr:5-oxoprolinase subunit PxpA [Porticoccaceae bacterium]
MNLLLNCDLGEAIDGNQVSVDSQIMPCIDCANICCGFHAGSPLIIKNTLALAKKHNVAVGAHPSYPDKANFGRRSIKMPATELIACLQYQIAALAGMAQNISLTLSYVKPHGALYNDMMSDGHLRSAVMASIAESGPNLAFMLQATADSEMHRQEAETFGLELYLEAFADRCYEDSGALVPRSKAGAILSREKMLEQVRQLKEDHSVTTINGRRLPLCADSLCVHGDNPQAVAAIGEIRSILST